MKTRLFLASLVVATAGLTASSAGATTITGCGLITHSMIKADGFDSVSYTHLTLPTIYSV